MTGYIALIHKTADSDFGVSFPDFPGCVSAGEDLEEARTLAEEALALHLQGMIEDGEPIPEPTKLEDIMAERENRDAVAFVVSAPTHLAKTVRINVTIPEDVLQAVDRYAKQHGLSRSAFLSRAALRAMDDAA